MTAKDAAEFLEREANREITITDDGGTSGYVAACSIKATAQHAIALWNKEEASNGNVH